jgi:ribosomal protein S18 acetylase RimI-like enzyme
MTLVIRSMRDQDADDVAGMVRGLARHVGTEFVPKVTGAGLLHERELVDVVVGERDGKLLGACLGLLTYSTWRGCRGLYVVDLFVEQEARGQRVGERLLRESARRAAAKGARFIKLEVDQTNITAERFYMRLGFNKKPEDRLHVLEQDRLTAFIAMGDGT